jgi:hypothetical protein
VQPVLLLLEGVRVGILGLQLQRRLSDLDVLVTAVEVKLSEVVCLVFLRAPRSFESPNTSLPTKSIEAILTLPPSSMR